MLNKILKVFLKVEADTTDAQNSLKGVQTDVENVKEAVEEIGNIPVGADNFEKLGDAAKEAGDSIKGVGDEVKKTDEKFKGLSGEDKIRALDGGVKLLAGSVQGLVGGLGLLGIESEAFGEFEKKAASAIAVGIGLKDFSEGVGQLKEAFDKAGGAAQIFGVTTKKALIATGIGALVVALGTVIAYWEEITDLVSGTSARIQAQNKELDRQITTNDTNLTLLDLSKQAAILRGESEVEINAEIRKQLIIQQENYKQQIASLELQLEQEKSKARELTLFEKILIAATANLPIQAQAYVIAQSFNENTAKAEELQTKLNEAKINAGNIDIKLATQENEQATKRKEYADVEKQRVEEYSNMLKQYKEEELDLLATTDQQKLDLEKQRGLAEIEQMKLTTAEKQKLTEQYLEVIALKQAELNAAEQQRLADNLQAEKDLQLELQSLQASRTDTLLDDAQAEIAITQEKYRLLMEEAVKNGQDTATLEKLQAEEISRINADFTKAEEDRIKELTEIDIASKEARKAAELSLVSATGTAIGALGGLFKQGSAAAKAAALADIATGTAVGFINALDIAQKSAKGTGPAAAFAFPLFYATQIGAVLAAASRAKGILQGGNATGGGMGSMSTPNVSTAGAPVLPQLAQGTSLQANQIGQAVAMQLSASPIKTYVSTKDLNTAGEFNRIQAGAARL